MWSQDSKQRQQSFALHGFEQSVNPKNSKTRRETKIIRFLPLEQNNEVYRLLDK